MSPMVSQRTIEDVRAGNDIVDTIGTYVQLKRAGSSFKGLCPFHQEKTPSFHVNPQRQSYHCFGCGAGGDVFKFVMEQEGVDFSTAIQMLARRAGVTIELSQGDARQGNKEQLYKLHDEVVLHYRKALDSPEGRRARDYLASRELDDDLVQQFLVGYAPDRKGSLLAWANQAKHPADLLVKAGLLTESEGGSGHYDRFHGRLMFPIRDEIGRVVGFSGRLLQDKAKAAKYVNSPETPLFRKSKVLYGMDLARKPMADQRRAIICEGQIDVMRCHRAGFTTAVAPQGTALTEEHARLLNRYADEVLFVFDADRAGQKAALRSGQLCLAAGLSVLVARMPDGQDPDGVIRAGGAEAFGRVLDQARNLVSFQVDTLDQGDELQTQAGLNRVAKALLQTIASAATQVQREALLREAADRLGLPEQALRADLRRAARARRTTRTRSDASSGSRPPSHPPEEVTLAELATQSQEARELIRTHLPLDLLHDADCRAIVEAALNLASEDEPLVSKLDSPTDECQRLAAQVLAHPPKLRGETFQPGDDVRDVLLVIWRRELQRRRSEVTRRAREAAGEEREKLAITRSQLTMDLERIRQGWETAQPIIEVSRSELFG